ncbi:Oidioi.mRNA.OKI2018_I69.chr1.g1902.t1.cds [Oikopleura dioica]|uniref:Oidioi.mRNA.OKI2018_I69.chr1.g1902.t1.cds n=1 Tax=Oikopleura dioica TaxID=34765 RepID=A0ABN7SPE1_OIKDI|nr:Oidioi.mRNA.OKI2018_I69.chr1.g1902.t1.cds [Oikopleura dioica]
MALAEINRKPHWCFNLAVETINSIPLREQKRFFLSAFREVLRRRVTATGPSSSLSRQKTDSLRDIPDNIMGSNI